MKLGKLEFTGNPQTERVVVKQIRLPCGPGGGGLAHSNRQGEPMQPIDETTRVVRNENLPTGEVDGELVALDLERGHCFGMDQVGSAVWSLAAEPVSVGAIVDSLTTSFDVERDRCFADLQPFVSDLIQEGLLRRLPD